MKREFVRYQHKEQATEYPDMMEIPVRRIVTRKETDEFCMAAEDEGSSDSMVMAVEDEEETVLAIKVIFLFLFCRLLDLFALYFQ